jgi:hypothetical protein
MPKSVSPHAFYLMPFTDLFTLLQQVMRRTHLIKSLGIHPKCMYSICAPCTGCGSFFAGERQGPWTACMRAYRASHRFTANLIVFFFTSSQPMPYVPSRATNERRTVRTTTFRSVSGRTEGACGLQQSGAMERKHKYVNQQPLPQRASQLSDSALD